MKKKPPTSLKGKKLKTLLFERDDYKTRYFKLVNRVKVQLLQIEAGENAIKRYESQIANNSLSYQIMKDKFEAMTSFITLKRPDVLRLIAATEKQKAAAHSGNLRPINVTVVQKKRMPKVEGL